MKEKKLFSAEVLSVRFAVASINKQSYGAAVAELNLLYSRILLTSSPDSPITILATHMVSLMPMGPPLD